MVIWLALNQEEEFHNALSWPAKSSLTLKPLCPLCSTTSVDGAIPWIVTTSSWYAERPDNVCKTMTILRCLRHWTALQKTKKQRQFVLQHQYPYPYRGGGRGGQNQPVEFHFFLRHVPDNAVHDKN